MNLQKAGAWPAIVVWLLAPLGIGFGLAAVGDTILSEAKLLVEMMLWFAWFVVLVATLVPSPFSLTVCRIAAPAVLAIVLIVAALSEVWDGAVVLAVGYAAFFTGLVFLPTFGDRMINGSAYGSERRMALRPPGFMLIGPVQLAWLLTFIGLTAAPLLVLGEAYTWALGAAVLGVGAVWVGGKILHQLARRWIVFVPAGFVIHDPKLLVDSLLLRRPDITALGPALADAQPEARIDLSAGALGLALEVAVKEPASLTLWDGRQARLTEASNLVFSPSLPGGLLSEARIRGIKIGTAPESPPA